MVQKKLVTMRKELNKQLREEMPFSTFYFSIYNGRIVKRSKYSDVAEKCDTQVSELFKEAIFEIKSEQKTIRTRSLPLPNEVIDSKLRAAETQRIRHISERITSNAITMLNNHYYWDRLQEHRVSEYLTEIEERQMKVDLKLKQSERCVPLKLKEPKEEKMETLDKTLH